MRYGLEQTLDRTTIRELGLRILRWPPAKEPVFLRLDCTRFRGHLQRLDRESRQEVGHEETSARWFDELFPREAMRLEESATMKIAEVAL